MNKVKLETKLNKTRKVLYSPLMEVFHDTSTECHLPYRITQCYLLADTSEHTPPSPQPCKPVLDLPTPEGYGRLS